jgi:lipopolysaccharide exporter
MAKFLNNVMKLVSGSVIAQTIGIVLIPVTTRLYIPEDFGIFQVFVSIASIIAVISALSYQAAIMLPKKDEDAAGIAVLSLLLIIATTSVCGIAVLFLHGRIAELVNVPEISPYLILLPVMIFFNALFLVLNTWLSRRVKYGTIAASRVANSISGKAVQIGAGVANPTPAGLISGMISGYAIANLWMLREVAGNLHLFRGVTLKKLRYFAVRYKKFPLFSIWSALANSLSLHVTPFLLLVFFSPAVVGYYSLANQMLNLPMTIVGTATGQVFFQKASEVFNLTGNLEPIVSLVYQRLVSIGIFPVLVLMIIGEDVFGFLLGPEWYVAGLYAKILSPWIFFVFISSPLTTIFSILEKQQIGLSFNVGILVSRVAALWIGGILGDPVSALTLYSITGVLFWGGMNLYILDMSGVRPVTGVRVLLRFAGIAAVAAAPLVVADLVGIHDVLLFLIAAVCMILYYLVILREDVIFRTEIRKLLNGGI